MHLDAEFFTELAFAGLICRLADTTTYQGPPIMPDRARHQDLIVNQPQAGAAQPPRKTWRSSRPAYEPTRSVSDGMTTPACGSVDCFFFGTQRFKALRSL